MLLSWLKRRRRAAAREAAAAEDWSHAFRTGLWQAAHLSDDERDCLRDNAAVLVAEKNWEGLDSVEVTPLVTRTAALQIALMTFGLEEEFFDRTPSILLEDGAYEAADEDYVGGALVRGRESRLGEAWYRGPVKLSWPEVRRAGRGPNGGHHLTVHEFAHQLDHRNGGDADGNPVIESAAEAARWDAACAAAFERLQDACDDRRRFGPRPVLDCYGATDRAEFFAVASEAFFQTPRDLKRREPDLFEVLQTFYRQDPLRWDR